MNEVIEFLKKPITIIFIGAVIAATGTMIVAIGTYLHNKSSSAKSTRIETGVNEGISIGKATGTNVEQLKSQNIKLIGKVDDQAKTIDDLRQENTDLHGKLREASKTIFENIKGGQDPLYVDAAQIDKGNYELTLENNNKLPVYGLTLEIHDYDELIKCNSVIEENNYVVDYPCYRKLSKGFGKDQLEIGRMFLNWGNNNIINSLSKEYGRYQIRIRTRDNTFYQQLIYKKVGNEVYTTSRLFRMLDPHSNNNKSEQVLIIKSSLKSWDVDFDQQFPTGIIIYMRAL